MISLGKIIAEAAAYSYEHISWFPSYGAEIRGGTAHCFVKVSDEPISSPFVESPDIAIIFNQPSWDKFKTIFNSNTLAILNSDLVAGPFKNYTRRSRAQKLPVGRRKLLSCPLNKIALSCGNLKVANTVALGLVLALNLRFLERKNVVSVLKKNFSDKEKQKQNLKALSEGEKLC